MHEPRNRQAEEERPPRAPYCHTSRISWFCSASRRVYGSSPVVRRGHHLRLVERPAPRWPVLVTACTMTASGSVAVRRVLEDDVVGPHLGDRVDDLLPRVGHPLRPATWTTSLTANGGAAPNVAGIRASGALAPSRSKPGSTVSRSTARFVVNAAGSALSRSPPEPARRRRRARRLYARPIRRWPPRRQPDAADRHQHVVTGAADGLVRGERVGGGGGEEGDPPGCPRRCRAARRASACRRRRRRRRAAACTTVAPAPHLDRLARLELRRAARRRRHHRVRGGAAVGGHGRVGPHHGDRQR